jgi:glycosyltransferase involved in cell wall biosynthesis
MVGSVGAIGWIKGPDVLIHVARRVLRAVGRDREIRFVWMGRPTLSWAEGELAYDVKAMGLEGRVRFIKARSDPRPVMSLFDVFALPSRSDPFPLVCLEAAALAKPIVCFDAGGMGEFLEPDEGLVVPYLDIDAMAARIGELLDSEQERTEIGRRLARRVRERHSLDVAAPTLLRIVERAVTASTQRNGLE